MIPASAPQILAPGPDSMDTLIGQRLGKYQIESLVGRGGMAAVYRAHDTVLNRSVAIKVLNPALGMDPRAVERFRREAVTAANLEHPAIVRVFDVQQSGSVHYIAMRFVQGTTLREILRDNGPLPLDAIVNIVKPVASALHYAHQHGVIHRDVKPGNILVEPDGTVLLTDFGIARAADAAQSALTQTGQVMGTADYLAPEQISGRPATPRSDVYSLGVVLYEMLTGVTPFAGETTASILYRQVHDNPAPIRSINPRLPGELQPIVDRALAKNPTLRYADPLDLGRDLEEVARWLPPGSPWLMGGRQSQQQGQAQGQPGMPGNGRRPSGSVDVGVAPRPVTRPHTGPSPYVAEAPETYFPPRNDVLVPAHQASRSRVALVLAVLLLLAGGVVIAAAAGWIPGLRGGAIGGPRFQAPGPVTYQGRTRQGNGPDIHVPKALAPINIDGDLSDWKGSTPNPVAASFVTLNKQAWGGENDLSSQFYFAWDDQNFYIGAVVTDDVHVQLPSTRGYQLYKGDDIEVWFDTNLDGDFTVNRGNEDDFQLGLSAGNFSDLGPEAVFWNPTPRSADRNQMVRVAAKPRPGTAGGYTLEAAVPWAAFGDFRPQPGMAIGFVASAGDNDKPTGNPDQELMISTTPNLRYSEPFTFGNLFF